MYDPAPPAADPHEALDELFAPVGFGSVPPQPRKSKLYLVGCGRLAWEQMPEPYRTAVEVAEAAADREPWTRTVRTAVRVAVEPLLRADDPAADAAEASAKLAAALGRPIPADGPPLPDPDTCRQFGVLANLALSPNLPPFRWLAARFHSLDLLAAIVGPAERPAVPDRWKTATVVGLAAGVYRDRRFCDLPVLADALEEIGCDHPAVLRHLRGPGPRARGDWVLDLLLNQG